MAQKGNNYRHGYFGTPTYKTLYKWDINKAINYLLKRGDLYGSKKNV